MGDNDDLDGFSELSLSAWVYPKSFTNPSSNRIIDKDGSYIFQFSGTAGTLYGRITNSTGDGAWATCSGFSLDTWEHAGLIYNGSYVQLYKGGLPCGSVSPTISSLP